jgi:hypothetical protein
MRGITAGVLVVGLVAGLASAAAARETTPLIEGRHSVLRAGMFATVIDSRHPIQILDRLCPEPGKRQGCEAVLRSLQRALEKRVDVRIRWVSRKHRDWGLFYEFGPVERSGSSAHFDYRWDNPRPYGCNGGGHVQFRRIDWTGWRESGGYFFEGCPAVPAGQE